MNGCRAALPHRLIIESADGLLTITEAVRHVSVKGRTIVTVTRKK